MYGYNKPVAWVTGANGFLGRALLKKLCSKNIDYIVLGNNIDDSIFKNDKNCLGVLSGKISRPVLLSAKNLKAPNIIYHLAGGSSVSAAETDPFSDFSRTVESTYLVAKFVAQEVPDALLVLASSAAVYGNQPVKPISEKAALIPVSNYGRHKLEAENLLRQINSIYGLRSAIIRFFSLYGPGLQKQIFWEIFKRIKAGEKQIILGGNGEEIRDFFYIEDATDLLINILSIKSGCDVLILNGGTGVGTTINEAVRVFIDHLGIKDVAPLFSGQFREFDPGYLFADSNMAMSYLDKRFIPLQQGLKYYVKWLNLQNH